MIEQKYTFFWGMHFSQWYPSNFIIDNIKFTTSEHYMMWAKAILFKDFETAKEILKSETPDEARWLGRQVKNFQIDTWEQNCKKIVYDGNFAKFTQNPKLLQYLKDTLGTKIVEASPEDFIWGIGMDEEEAKKTPENEWKGTNWLGEILTQLRTNLFA